MNIVKNLLPFQYDGVKFAVNLNGRVLLAGIELIFNSLFMVFRGWFRPGLQS
jgi:hypothetical protein